MPLPLDLELAEDSLLLRPWQPDDAPALHAAVQESMETVGRWMPWCHAGYDLGQAQAWIRHCREAWAAEEQFAFGVFAPDDGRLLGSIGLNHRNRMHRSAALGYWVRQSCQGRGIARRATRIAARFGFQMLGLVRIEIVALPDNQASRRTAEQAGARFECIARQRLWERDQARDAAVYALVPGDLTPQGPTANNAHM